MTLGRKMLLKTAGLILSLVLLTAAAVWGLVGLSGQFDQALSDLKEQSGSLDAALTEYEKLRIIFGIGQNATRTIGLLNTRGAKDPDTLRQMRLTVDQFADFRAQYPWRPATTRPATQPEENPGRAHGEDVLRTLRAAIAQAEHPDPFRPGINPGAGANPGVDSAPQLTAFNALVSHLADRTVYTQHRIQQVQAAADARRAKVDQLHATAVARFHTHLILIGLIAGLTIGGAVTLTLSQYRGVMRPLLRLRSGVRAITGGRFSRRLDVTGDDELAELARDFNQMAEELEALYRELEEKVAVKSRELVRSERLASVGFLAAGVAHEINNPLSIITGYAELSLRELGKVPGGASEKTIQSLQVICDEAFRCKQITQKLLSLARGAPGAPGFPGRPAREPVSLAAVAEDVALMVRGLSLFQRRKVTLRFDSANDVTVLGNESEMKQVLLNLTVNALEAVADDTGEVVIEGRRRGDAVELAVIDNGRGMTARTLEHVFEPFYTDKRGTDPTGPGTGLGLSIVHAIVESHGGKIAAASAGMGQGSRFVITFPAVPANAAANTTVH
jgi:two-component system, NtrC family, sensor kinase